jgi:multidrug resistance efflux pump
LVLFARGLRTAPAEVPTTAVVRGDFEQRVPASGNLEAVHATPVAVPLEGPGPFRIGWLAPDGSRVRQGEVVIRFDSSEIEKRLMDAGDDLREARLRLGKQQVEGRAKIEKIERDLGLARLELENANQFQKKDDVIFSRHEIIESDIDRDLAREKTEHASGAQRTEAKLGRTEDALLQIKIRQAEARIALARSGLAALTVTAPHDGVFILKRNWRGDPTRVGDTAWNGQPLAEIPDLAAMQAEVFVLEADAGELKAGKAASLTVESAPGRIFGARVERVDSLAKPRIPGSPVQYFAVTLQLDRTDPSVMKPGQRVQSTILLERRKGALLVPRQALFEVEGKTVVYRRGRSERGTFEPIEVKLGPAGTGRAVVESGVGEGEVLALVDPTRREAKPGAQPTPAATSDSPAR